MPAAGNSSKSAKPLERRNKSGEPLLGPLLAAAGTAIIVCIAALVSAVLVRSHLVTVAQSDFDARAAHVTSDIRRQLLLCSQLLRGASGFVVAQAQTAGDGTPSFETWERYISRLDLDDAPPCVRSLGYATALPRATGSPSSGSEASGALARTVLMWPPRADAPNGTEIGLSDVTRGALLRAANSGQVAMAIRALSRESSSRARVDLYLPVYRMSPPPALIPARRAALIGFALARLDAEYLFASIAASEPRMELSVSGGQPPLALYPPGAPVGEQDSPGFQRTDSVRFGGETLSLVYTTRDPSMLTSANYSASAIIAAGLATALIGAAAVFILLRKRGITIAEAGVARARASRDEVRLLAIIRSSNEAIITIDEQQRILMFNPAAEKVFRCSAMDAIGTSIDQFIPERFRQAHRKHIERFGETAVAERRMGGKQQPVLLALRADGEEFPIEASISQFRDGTGKFYTVMLRDVTERLQAEDELKASRQELRALSANLQNVREDEKTRIARELHDDLGQQLTALKMDLSSVEQSLADMPNAPPPVLAQLHGMRRLIDSTVGSVRRIAADLRPVMLDDLGLMPAIDWLLTDFTTRYGIDVERRIDPGQTQFSRNGATTVFRIIQEALTNVAKHAEATRVELSLTV
ncbi:MAG: sensor histidine kinase, partial [Trinickia sp.]